MIEWLSLLGTSLGLGAGAGLNSYATMLVFGLVARFRPESFPGDLAQFFGSTPVLIVVAVLYTIEFVADKFPAVDHAWDVVHTFIRPVAGAFVAVAAADPGMSRGAVMLATVVGGTAALGGHLTKATVRAGSTATTGGTANPVLSLIEDVLAVVQVIIAIFLPLIVLVVTAVLIVAVVLWLRRRRLRQGHA